MFGTIISGDTPLDNANFALAHKMLINYESPNDLNGIIGFVWLYGKALAEKRSQMGADRRCLR